MSKRYQGGILGAGFNPLRAPNAPTIGTATALTTTTASVAFTAPACVGGSAITSYAVRANCGIGASGSSSPITVSGLTTGTAYTFTVSATNSYGPSPASGASNSVTPQPVIGQQAYTTAGTYSWVAPACVTSVSVVAVGGGGGSGGALGYKNNYSVTPGSSYTVIVGSGRGTGSSSPGNPSSFVNTSTLRAGGGGCTGGTYTGDGGGNGGNASTYTGGGAGGYSGNGGGGAGLANGSGGAGAGGGGGGAGNWYCCGVYRGGGGGGVGILGQGSNGTGGVGGSSATGGGGGGSGGSAGGKSNNCQGAGGTYGGGGGGSSLPTYRAAGGVGAVRIIWPGTSRQFPSTCTGDK